MTTPSAPRPDIPNALQLTVRYTQAGQNSAVVLGFTRQSPLGTAESPTQTLAQSLLQYVNDQLRECFTATTVNAGGTLRSLASDRSVWELAATNPAAGDVSGDPAVAAASALLKWRTLNGTRSGKGKTFVPGFPAGWVAPGGRSIQPTAIPIIQAAGEGLLAVGTVWPGLNLAVVSWKDATARIVTGVSVGPVIGIQRKRMRA